MVKKLTIIVGGSMSNDLKKIFDDSEFRKHQPSNTLYLTKKQLFLHLTDDGKKFFEKELKKESS